MNRVTINAIAIGGWLWSLAFAIYSAAGLPERVPVHFGVGGTPDRWGGKLEGALSLLLMPALLLFVNGLIVLLERFDVRARAQAKFLDLTRVGVTVLLLVVQLAVAQSMQSLRFDARLVLVATGVLMAVLGNIMPKVTPNPYAGVRLPYTFASDRAWRAANRAGGWLLFVVGMLLTLSAALLPSALAPYAVIGMAIALLGGLGWLFVIARREYERDPERRPLG
jgi:uncharacterized membrane protein